MEKQELEKLKDMLKTYLAPTVASQIMIKVLLYLHFAEHPDADLKLDGLRKKVLTYVEREFADQPEVARHIESLFSNFRFNDSFFDDLIIDETISDIAS